MSINQPVIDSTVTNATSGRRLWLMRVLALTLGCLPFLLLESLLWCVGWPPAAPALDPLVDLNHLQPLFERSADGQSYAIGPERYNLFRPAQFAARKPEDTFRIFALGGSTTQGEPYSTETAFPEWLRIYLQAASPGRSIEAINCGGLSYASYRVQAILTEVLAYSPDLIVIYTGQNEFLEQRSYAGWRDIPLPLARAQSWLDRSRVVQSIRWGIQGPADREARLADPTVMSREVEALLDYAGGLEAYHRSDPWREPVVAHFRWNVAHMVEQCQQAGVPVILMCPVVNLLDCPPMKFETRADLSLDDRTRFESAWQTAQQATDPQVARAALQTAQAIDPEHAGVHFFIGRLAWEAGQWDEAARWLSSARDLDVCPLRALSSMQTAVREIAVQYQVPLIDADQLFQTLSPHGLVGNQWLVDHVHPTIEGHQVLGEALCELVLKQGWFVARDPQWRETARPVIRQVLSGLGEDYFQRGKQRLEGLLLWTQGRAKKIRPQQ